MIFLKPIDNEILKEVADNFKLVLTLEDGCIKGGLFGEVSEYMVNHGIDIKVECSGIPDRFIEQDKQDSQRHECGLDTESIQEKMKIIIEKHQKVLENKN